MERRRIPNPGCDQRSGETALPNVVGRGVAPTQRCLSVMPARVPSNCTNAPLLVPRNAYILSGFQLVRVVAFAVSSYTVGPVAPPSLTASLNEVGVQNACHRYTFDGSRIKMFANRSSTSTELPLSPRMALNVMQLAGAPPAPRYCTLNEYLAAEAIVPARSSIEKILGL